MRAVDARTAASVRIGSADPTARDEGAGTAVRADRERGDRIVVVAAVALVLLPLVVSAAAVGLGVGEPWYPWSDWALTEMQVRDVGRHPVELGLYSRDGWGHPGPILFYVLALPYRLVGGHPAGLLLGALVINGASVVAMAWLARRRGGVPLLLCTLLASAVLLGALGADLWRDPWVCYVTTLPFGVLLFLSWAMACGDRWALPAGAVLTTFLAQTHVGFVAVAVPVLLWGAGSLAWRVRRGGDRGTGPGWTSLAVPTAVTLGILAVLWLPPLMQELGGGEGNLTRTVRYFRDTKEEPHALIEGYRVVLGQFGLPPEWVSGIRPPNPFTGATRLADDAPPPILLVPVLVAVVALARRRDWDGVRLFGVVAVGVAVGVAAVARTLGIMYQYRLLWTLLLPAVAMAGAAWVGWSAVERRWPGVHRRLFVPLALVALAGLAAANSWSGVKADPPHAAESDISRPVVTQLLRELPEAEGDVLVRYPDPGSWWYATSVLNELERRGVAAKVDADPARIYGRNRVHRDDDRVRAILTVASGSQYDEMAADPPGRLVAYVSDRPPAERARDLASTREQNETIEARLQAGELTPSQLPEARRRAGVPGSVTAVFLEEPG